MAAPRKFAWPLTGVNSFLGSNPDNTVGNSDDVGARITNARLGGVFYRTSAGAKSYALDAKGTGTIVGVDGLIASGELAARVNTTGGVVNETITMPSGAPVVVNFAATDPSAVFSGRVDATLADFATISGSFAVAKSGNQLTVAASNVTGFVGTGDLGVSLSDGDLGVVIKTDTKKFAAVASGSAVLGGVSDLTVTGSGSFRINKLGEAITETIRTPDGDVVTSISRLAPIRCRSAGF
ncbi:MAG UNVERIFIED_CONTAM: hypothetical protein LVR18_01025 [Planctomycetaceae bacterium]|jgi:hypothetical protein